MERQYIYAHTARGCLAGAAALIATVIAATVLGLLTRSWLVASLVAVGVPFALVSWVHQVDRRARQAAVRRGAG